MIPELAALVPSLLARAEAIFGPREGGWTLPTVANHTNGPILECSAAPGVLTIYLNLNERSSFDQGVYQLSHEIAHCLNPVHPPPATMLEEGMCVWFSLYEAPFRSPDYLGSAELWLATNPSSINYRDALRLYNELSALDAEAIKKIRLTHRIDDVTPDVIRAAVPQVSEDLAIQLCRRRDMR